MPVDQARLKRKLKQKQRPQSSGRSLEFAIIGLLLVALVVILGFIWQAVSLRQPEPTPEPIAARADVVPATATVPPAPQSWYVVVTPVPPRPTAVPRYNYNYASSPNVQPAAAPQTAYEPSDEELCAGAADCRYMTSCEQALACLRLGNPNIDGDRDGRPCERTLCGN